MDQNKLFRIIKNPIVHWGIVVVIGIVLYKVDSTLTQPLWEYVFGMPIEEAEWLSRGMAAIYLILAYISARLLARGDKSEFKIAVAVFLALNVFSLLGQYAAQELKEAGPLGGFFEDENPIEVTNSMASYSHWISTGITLVLWVAAVMVEFLIARADGEVKGDKKKLSLSSLYRWFQSKIILLQGEFDRVLIKLNVLAKDKVDNRIEKLNNQVTECERKQRQLLGEQSYQIELIELMHQQQIEIIKAVYNKKRPPFFKSIFI